MLAGLLQLENVDAGMEPSLIMVFSETHHGFQASPVVPDASRSASWDVLSDGVFLMQLDRAVYPKLNQR